jgi:hypothetical protein
MSIFPPLPEQLAIEAGFLTEPERSQLWEAAVLMADSRNLLVRFAGLFGRQITGLNRIAGRVGTRIGSEAWSSFPHRAQEMVEDVLWSSYSYATLGLDTVPHFLRPKESRKNYFHQLATTASGAASGFIGLPGALIDIPFTTTVILRSIAEIARDCGEDLSAEETKRACLEVMALGTPGTGGEDTEAGYWAARLGMSHLAINLLIRSAAGRFSLVLSEKMMAQMVPLAGAITGALMNYGFTDYYQSMAKVHFCLRALERRTGEPEAIKIVFVAMVRAARERRRIVKRQDIKQTLLTAH